MSSREQLAQAVQDAVAAGDEEIELLRVQVDSALKILRKAIRTASAWTPAGDDLARGFSDSLNESRTDLERLFKSQASALQTFNITFFGRTGAGKSSLLEAFSRGNGTGVSDGRSDWTTDVHSVDWKGVRLIDTPGINGWGASQSREQLESTARGAVETSDIVLLCFDTHSQQITEFSKVAAWVKSYGKPVLAVLNVKDSFWRDPRRAPELDRRQALSQTVSEHYAHIEACLEQIGLAGTPIVALNTRRALEARAQTPFKGPDLEGFEARRKEIGKQRLAAWSNYETLEQILIAAVRDGAVDLRLAVLRDGVRLAVSRVRTDLAEHQDQAGRASQAAIATVEASFNILGRPTAVEHRRLRVTTGPKRGRDLFNECETALERELNAPSKGTLTRYTSRLLSARLEPVRRESLNKAEDLISSTFRSRARVSQSTFRKAVYDEAAIAETTQSIFASAVSYAGNKFGAIAETQSQELLLNARAREIRADRTRARRISSNVSGAAGVMAGLAGTLAAIGAANIWNPLGWAAGTLAVAAVLTGVVSGVFNWLRRKLFASAERAHAAQRGKMLGEARGVVNASFDDLAERLATSISAAVWKQASPLLREQLGLVIACLSMQSRSSAAVTLFDDLLRQLPTAPSPREVMARAARAGTGAAGRDLVGAALRGEDWLRWPDVSKDDSQLGNVERQQILRDASTELLEGKGVGPEQLPEAWAMAEPGTVLAALDAILQQAERWPALREVADRAAARVREGRPLVAVVGDYSTGKSSLIARLLHEGGQAIPDTLQIGGAPVTDAVTDYRWGDLDLRDVPGFESGDEAHDELGELGLEEAFLLLVLQGKNFFVGQGRLTEALRRRQLDGSRQQDIAAFLIGRSDELVSDPLDSPTEFARASEAKVHELDAALRTIGIAARAEATWCIAADPRRVMNSRSSTGREILGTDWDGVDLLVRDLLGAPEEQLRRAAAASASRGLVASASRRELELARVRHQAEVSLTAFQRLSDELARAVESAHDLEGQLLEEAKELCSATVREPLDLALGSAEEAIIDANARVLRSWWTTKAFASAAREYDAKAARRVEAWRAEVEQALDRVLASEAFRSTELDHDPLHQVSFSGGSKAKSAAKHLGRTGRVLGTLRRDGVYEIGKQLGYRFKPWEAVRLGARTARVGAVLSAAGVALDVASWARDSKQANKRSQAQEELRHYVRSSVSTVAEQLAGVETAGDRDAGLGALGYLRAMQSSLTACGVENEAALHETRADRQEAEEESRFLHSLCATLSTRAALPLGALQ